MVSQTIRHYQSINDHTEAISQRFEFLFFGIDFLHNKKNSNHFSQVFFFIVRSECLTCKLLIVNVFFSLAKNSEILKRHFDSNFPSIQNPVPAIKKTGLYGKLSHPSH